VEGKSSKNYAVIKAMAFQEPALLHQLLGHLADAIATYVRYQIDSGAQVVATVSTPGQASSAPSITTSSPPPTRNGWWIR